MKEYPAENIRNVAVVGHGGSGKTSLSEAILFASGAVTRLGKVEDGTTISDWDPDEQKRGHSVNLSILPLEWNGTKINILDTPGYADFTGEIKCSLRAVELALINVCGAAGVQVGTEFAWEFADELELPRALFINRMDRENADFTATVSRLQELWGQKCLPLLVPVRADQDLTGVVDLLTMKAYMGESGEEQAVPSEMAAQMDSLRERLIEAASETDDSLITKYLDGQKLTNDELTQGIRTGIRSGSIVPILAGSAITLVGLRRLLDTIVTLFPSPLIRPPRLDDTTLKPDASAPLAALVFKTAADQYVGGLTYFRVFSGTLKADSQVWNSNRKAAERIGPVYHLSGKNQGQIAQAVAGDIGVVAKLAETHTDDTLTTKEVAVTFAPTSFPDPTFSAAVSPKTKADLDKMGVALQRIVEEDPILRIERSLDTGETVLSGLGESHVGVALEKIRRKFNVDLDMAMPRVPYKETVTSTGQAEYTHKKQTGGHGQYARVVLKVDPLPRGEGVHFQNKTVGGTVPKQYVGSVEKGVDEATHDGILAHFPLVDVQVSLVDGREHPVDSSDIAFKIAASMALKKGTEDAHPALLEPVMNMKIMVPEAHTGDIISDLNGKRARVVGMVPSDTMTMVEAQAPLAEIQRYSADLRSMTQGRGQYSMAFSHYEEAPPQVAQRVIEQAQKAWRAAHA